MSAFAEALGGLAQDYGNAGVLKQKMDVAQNEMQLRNAHEALYGAIAKKQLAQADIMAQAEARKASIPLFMGQPYNEGGKRYHDFWDVKAGRPGRIELQPEETLIDAFSRDFTSRMGRAPNETEKAAVLFHQYGMNVPKDTDKPEKPENRDDRAISILARMGPGKPPISQEDRDWLTGFKAWVDWTKTQPGVARVNALNLGKPATVQDPITGAVTYSTFGDAVKNKSFSPQTNILKNAYQPKSRFDDVARVVANVNANVDAMDQGPQQKTLISSALVDPGSQGPGAVSNFIASELYKNMNPKSRDYVNNVLSLREQVMALNGMLTGSVGLTDARTIALWNTIPSLEPDSDNARRKMTLVQGMVENLKTGFPGMSLVPGPKKPQVQVGPDGSITIGTAP